MLHRAGSRATTTLARRHALGQSTQQRITSPRLLIVSAQHVPPQSPRARSDRHTTPEAPAGAPGAGSDRAEGSQGPKSTWAGGRAQKRTRGSRNQIVFAMDMCSCTRLAKGDPKYISAHGPQPGYLAPGATWPCSNVPPVLAHLLPLRLVTPRATPDCSKRAACAPGAAVNRGWREADDRKGQGCLQTLVKLAHRPL